MLHARMHDLSTIPASAARIDDLTFDELDRLRDDLGVAQVKLCQRADLNPATYMRWRKWVRGEPGGSEPRSRSLKAVRDVLRDEVERRRSRLDQERSPERPAA
jgi:transposase-like protein